LSDESDEHITFKGIRIEGEREPYEKPEVTTIDLGNLIDEAQRGYAELSAKIAQLRADTDDAQNEAMMLVGDLATARLELDDIKKKHLVAQTILELQEHAGGEKPAGG
jgi:hypothetical protein